MSLDGAAKVIDPRNEFTRFKILESAGILRPEAGPFRNGIGYAKGLTKRLMRSPSSPFNPLPGPGLAAAVRAQNAVLRAVRRKGPKFIAGGYGIISPRGMHALRGKSRKPVANVKRHVNEV